MAFALTHRVEIGNYLLVSVNDVQVTSSRKVLGDVCRIKLGGLASQLSKFFSVGDVANVYLGYDGDDRLVFSGYVSKVSPNMPFELLLVDEVFIYSRSERFSEIFNGSLSSLISKYFTGVVLGTIPSVELFNFEIDRLTLTEILEKIKKDYGFDVYFRGKILNIGLPYTLSGGQEFIYNMVGPVGNVVASDLSFWDESNIELSIRAISINTDNTRTEVSVGASGGVQRTVYYTNVKNQDALSEIAESDLQQYRYNGYVGSVTGFGLPFVQHSDSLRLFDERYPEREGVYFVDSVTIGFGDRGYRRKCELGIRLDI